MFFFNINSGLWKVDTIKLYQSKLKVGIPIAQKDSAFLLLYWKYRDALEIKSVVLIRDFKLKLF